MNYHAYGESGAPVLVLIHPSAVTWDYFERVIPLLEQDYHLFVPVLPGYDLSNDSDFTSVEQIAAELAEQLLEQGVTEAAAIYGCSMGGSITLRMAVDGKLPAGHYILDGGITPYQLPWLLTRLIALRDFGMMAMGKLGGEKLMVKAFSSSDYSDEDYKYLAEILRHCSCKTLWNTFDSCNNYKMPKEVMRFKGAVHYWYGAKERKARDWDLKYMRKFVPDTEFREFPGIDHTDLAFFHPEQFVEAIRRTLEGQAK